MISSSSKVDTVVKVGVFFSHLGKRMKKHRTQKPVPDVLGDSESLSPAVHSAVVLSKDILTQRRTMPGYTLALLDSYLFCLCQHTVPCCIWQEKNFLVWMTNGVVSYLAISVLVFKPF